MPAPWAIFSHLFFLAGPLQYAANTSACHAEDPGSVPGGGVLTWKPVQKCEGTGAEFVLPRSTPVSVEPLRSRRPFVGRSEMLCGLYACGRHARAASLSPRVLFAQHVDTERPNIQEYAGDTAIPEAG